MPSLDKGKFVFILFGDITLKLEGEFMGSSFICYFAYAISGGFE